MFVNTVHATLDAGNEAEVFTLDFIEDDDGWKTVPLFFKQNKLYYIITHAN